MICHTPQTTTDNKNTSKEGNCKIAAATIAVKPAAGPLTLKLEPLKLPITIPPIIPAIIPLNKGALDAKATPKQRGKATKKTTIEEGKSDDRFLKIVERLIIIFLRIDNKSLMITMYIITNQNGDRQVTTWV